MAKASNISDSVSRFHVPTTAKDSARAQPASCKIAVLTAAMAEGDEDGYRLFYELYFKRILCYLLVLTQGNEETSKEVLQLTFIKIARHVRKFESEDVFWSWLTVLARSSVVDESRRRNRYLALLERFWIRKELVGEAVSDAYEEMLRMLERKMELLEEKDRRLICEKYLNGKSIKQLSLETGCSEKSLESQLGRIRKKLRYSLNGRSSDE